MNVMWPAPSSFCHGDSPSVVDRKLQLWARGNLFPFKLFFSWDFMTATRVETQIPLYPSFINFLLRIWLPCTFSSNISSITSIIINNINFHCYSLSPNYHCTELVYFCATILWGSWSPFCVLNDFSGWNRVIRKTWSNQIECSHYSTNTSNS